MSKRNNRDPWGAPLDLAMISPLFIVNVAQLPRQASHHKGLDIVIPKIPFVASWQIRILLEYTEFLHQKHQQWFQSLHMCLFPNLLLVIKSAFHVSFQENHGLNKPHHTLPLTNGSTCDGLILDHAIFVFCTFARWKVSKCMVTVYLVFFTLVVLFNCTKPQ